MKETRLIQRVRKPYKPKDGKIAAVANAFSFGGGLRNGGLGKEAVELLAPIFSFDYMGAAEFEFGAVPEGLTKIVEHAKDGGVVLRELEFNLKDIKTGWLPKDAKLKEGKGKVWVVCSSKDEKEVLKRVRKLIRDEFGARSKEIFLKERLNLGEKLRVEHRWHEDLIGGLELDNGFFITIDEETAKKFYALFAEQE